MKNTKTMKNRILIAIVCIAAFASAAYAQGMAGQTPTSTKGAVIKGKAPVNKSLLKVTLPKAQEGTLKNGLHVVLLQSTNQLPIFSMEMVVMSGGLSDPADMRGLASITALQLREGTAKHKSREMAEALDTIGATLTANSGVSSTTSNVSASASSPCSTTRSASRSTRIETPQGRARASTGCSGAWTRRSIARCCGTCSSRRSACRKGSASSRSTSKQGFAPG